MSAEPHATGRSVVVRPGADPPPAWAGCERVAVASTDPETIERLDAAWRERRSLVIELADEMAGTFGDPAVPPAPAIAAGQPWELTPDLAIDADRLHHALWDNAVDSRSASATHHWSRAAIALGAEPAPADSPADVVLPDGTLAVCDGGPLDIELPGRLGHAVVHRIALEHGALAPLGRNQTSAELAPDQLEAVLHPTGAARVIAPAGSGKTRVLTERARTLLREWGIPPAALAVVAFNRRAADELRARTTDLAGLRIRTLNALGLRLLPDGVRTIEEPAARDHLAALVKLPRRAEADPAAPWLEALSRVRLGLADPTTVEAELPDVSGLEPVAVGYRGRLAQRGEADFDEQVVGAIERLLGDGAFRLRAQRHARVLLVDELQDLTPAHVLLLRLLTGPAGAVYGVGDDDQTIYGYAGATPRWLVDFTTYFPGAGTHALEVNYRCPPAVVTAARNVLTRNALRVSKDIRPAPDAADDADALRVHHAGDQLVTATAQRVRDLIDGGAAPSGIAVLARVNAALAPVQVTLHHHGISVHGGVDGRFLHRGGVRAALAWLRLATADRGLSGPVLREAARRPKRGMRDSLLDLIARQRDEDGLAQLASWLDGKGSDREATKVLDLAGDIAVVRRAAQTGTTADVLQVVRHRIGAGGLDESASALDAWSRGTVASHGDDLDALSSLAALQPDPARFPAWLANALEAPDDAEGVTLASIHAVKGREWPHVIVHHATAGILPHRLVLDIEEERRTFHVGITRGRTTVDVVAGAPPSPFLAEMATPGEPAPAPRPTATAATARASVAGRPVPRAPDVTEALAELAFGRLREWRAARAAGKPAYTVFADRTLRELAARLPTTEVGLRAITGVGPAKLDAYGDELLALAAELRAAADARAT